ncbi:cytochrome c biogenesis CcdA family protein [Methanotorris igneus]|uniref:Cytochrome c biogenesis protein transmembrane region n=1 Tax=Methanotorris igneus (strain DSM 5666 / JCM 11834 / Kol 5) TaxID=880724 RepID=F6BCM8_METIK|nr:cytochrome c biogenesis CcdA family protein [Methanotorris igneus]AEF96239.1 cytochrome c biogenesis protein transmembrane region [Methanotorris igneus Kol 5]
MDLLLIFFAGLFTALGPCVITILPISLAYTFGVSNSKKEGFIVSLFFVLGLSLIFSLLGVISAVFGSTFDLYKLKFIAGILAIAFGFSTLFNYKLSILTDSLNKFRSYLNKAKNKKFQFSSLKYLNAFLFGFFYGVTANTCADPVLITILSYTATKSDILFGFIALFIYSIGFGIPIIILSTLGAEGKSIINKITKPRVINIISGVILIVLGIYVIFN